MAKAATVDDHIKDFLPEIQAKLLAVRSLNLTSLPHSLE